MAEKLFCEFCGGSDNQCGDCLREQAARDLAGANAAYYAHKAARRLDTAFHALAVCVVLTLVGLVAVGLCALFSLDPPPPTATYQERP